MKTLLLLRHAKSSWSDGSLPDHERPLNDRGRQAAPQMGRLLAALRLTPDRILSSTAVRARDTANLVARSAGYPGEVEQRRELYHASPEACLAAACSLPETCRSAMIVAHNPGLEELVSQIAGAHERFPTAALAQVELDIASWTDLQGWSQARLVNVWRPKELDG
ncbi:MAG: histidine phosphatase family protein [Planctomycetes bacterium]|nr:histidine phosphatase family protein [Planctomycetota bacterium]